jgi:hypothetical protein
LIHIKTVRSERGHLLPRFEEERMPIETIVMAVMPVIATALALTAGIWADFHARAGGRTDGH